MQVPALPLSNGLAEASGRGQHGRAQQIGRRVDVDEDRVRFHRVQIATRHVA